MKIKVLVAAAVVTTSSAALANPILNPFNLDDASPGGPHTWLFGAYTNGGPAGGNTYSAAVMAQTPTSAFFISSASPSTHTFGAVEAAGDNLTSPPDGTFVIASQISVTGPTTRLIQVEVTALDAAGAPTAWIAAGQAAPSGPFTSWRLDIGSNSAGDNKIEVQDLVSVDSGQFTVFNSAGGAIGTFNLSLNSSDLTGLSGVAVVGLGGADIAGFDLASIQMFWNVTVVPVPGALALFGLAGLSGVRRRRR